MWSVFLYLSNNVLAWHAGSSQINSSLGQGWLIIITHKGKKQKRGCIHPDYNIPWQSLKQTVRYLWPTEWRIVTAKHFFKRKPIFASVWWKKKQLNKIASLFIFFTVKLNVIKQWFIEMNLKRNLCWFCHNSKHHNAKFSDRVECETVEM